jgi:ParB family chromosome partitioning protein
MDFPKTADMELRIIDLEAIESTPGPYCMSFGFDPNWLAQSIRRVGLVNSPLLIEDGQGPLRVISGYRRIQALKALGWKQVACRCLSESQLSPLECLCLNLFENLATRKLNKVEKGMVLSRLSMWVTKNELLETYVPLLELPSHESTLAVFLRIEEELDDTIKDYLVRKHLPLENLKMLLELDPKTRTYLFNLFSIIKFNSNQQKQLIDYIVDIAHKENRTVPQLIGEMSFQRILSDHRLNNPQKAKAILLLLRSRRFPSLVEAERAFQKKVSSLNLPEGVRIVAPSYFEASHYLLEVRFQGGVDLVQKIDRLSETADLRQLRNPWEEVA